MTSRYKRMPLLFTSFWMSFASEKLEKSFPHWKEWSVGGEGFRRRRSRGRAGGHAA
jgi:hypothetical protein